jgi:hypothetical protein
MLNALPALLPTLAVFTTDASAFRQAYVLALYSCVFAFVTMHQTTPYGRMIAISVLDADCDDNLMLPNSPVTLLVPAT